MSDEITEQSEGKQYAGTSGSPPIGKLDWDACLKCKNWYEKFGCSIPPDEMDDAFEVDAFNDSVHCTYFLSNATDETRGTET